MTVENDLTVIQQRLKSLYALVDVIAKDQHADRAVLNAIAADMRVGRYCKFLGSDWSNQIEREKAKVIPLGSAPVVALKASRKRRRKTKKRGK